MLGVCKGYGGYFAVLTRRDCTMYLLVVNHCTIVAVCKRNALQVRVIILAGFLYPEPCPQRDTGDGCFACAFNLNRLYNAFAFQSQAADVGKGDGKGVVTIQRFITCGLLFDGKLTGFYLVDVLYFQLGKRRIHPGIGIAVGAENDGVGAFRVCFTSCFIASICNICCSIVNLLPSIIRAAGIDVLKVRNLARVVTLFPVAMVVTGTSFS